MALTADAKTVAANLRRVRRRVVDACARSGRDPDAVRLCAATKYVDAQGMLALHHAGVRIAGENRLQDLRTKQERFADAFEWHFIGRVQSRKAAEIARRVDMIHSLASESARDRLNAAQPFSARVLVQVNVSREPTKAGVLPELLDEFIAGCEFGIDGLMTMPPLSAHPEAVRAHFRVLASLADEHGLLELSMGTTQDFEVAVEEGATLVRVGSALFGPVADRDPPLGI